MIANYVAWVWQQNVYIEMALTWGVSSLMLIAGPMLTVFYWQFDQRKTKIRNIFLVPIGILLSISFLPYFIILGTPTS
jgi:hypothetical protein